MTASAQPLPAHGHPPQSSPRAILDVKETACCVVGGGPGGAMLALLLARKGVPVTLLESHHDFDRDFRGDTVHPSTLEVLDQIGLLERALKLPHSKMREAAVQTSAGRTGIDLSILGGRFPYIMMLPQVLFLDFLVAEAKRFPAFRLVMGARVEELVTEHGQVRGVRYESEDGWHEVRAQVTVGADGRFSKVRMLAGIETVKSSVPTDVCWFRLPRKESDPHGVNGNVRGGRLAIMLERPDDWQIGFIIRKGGFQELRAAGIESLRKAVAELIPLLADRVDHLESFKQVTMLSIESSRVERWYKPGLLLIGDAAHTMSPVGGVGINYAIMDAVEAANVLTRPLAEKRVDTEHLAEVQRRREWPVRVVQLFQNFAQRQILKVGMQPSQQPTAPFFMRYGFLRKRLARFMAYGVKPAHLEEP